MDNPQPKRVFFADVGRRNNSEYCDVGNGYVVEAEYYDSIHVSAIRVWKPIMRSENVDFNAHMVSSWEVQKEQWYNNNLDFMSRFESVCSCEENLIEFLDN